MNEISVVGWIVIAGLGLIVLSSYLSLLSLLRKKNNKPSQISWIKSWQALTRPYEAENKHLEELSERVSDLKKDISPVDWSNKDPEPPLS
ncbi:MAG: hypothetical protein ACYC11_08685 [Bellilinea sp.]